jgi:hypothetical protein
VVLGDMLNGSLRHPSTREKKLSALNELLPLLEAAVQAGKPLLIIAEDVEHAMWFLGVQLELPLDKFPDDLRARALSYWDRRLAATVRAL